jgi:excisionase family DNA binding protein
MSAELVGGTEGGTSGGPGPQGAVPPRYSVPEAARVLGISERAVRKRITANTLPATRTAAGWLVELAAVPRAVPGPPRAVPAAEQGGTAEPAGGPGAVPAALLEEVRHQRDHLEHQVADLHQRLEASEQAQAELRRLLAAALQQRALPASSNLAPGGAKSESRPWYARLAAWWRR